MKSWRLQRDRDVSKASEVKVIVDNSPKVVTSSADAAEALQQAQESKSFAVAMAVALG